MKERETVCACVRSCAGLDMMWNHRTDDRSCYLLLTRETNAKIKKDIRMSEVGTVTYKKEF